MATILAWLKLGAAAVAAVFGFFRELLDALQSYEDREAGRAEEAAKINAESAKAQGRIADTAAKDVSEDDAISRLDRGDA